MGRNSADPIWLHWNHKSGEKDKQKMQCKYRLNFFFKTKFNAFDWRVLGVKGM
jgi:hypothetical protein